MNKYLAAYAATLAVVVALDMLWLGVIAKNLYQEAIGHLMTDRPFYAVVVAFYLIYAAGLVVFVLLPYGEQPQWSTTLLMGGLFGFCAYATYDLSNLATLRNWPVHLTVVDLCWGTVLSAIGASAGKAALHWAVRP